MLKAYKYRIYPNSEQALAFEKHFGCSRFVFNWALALQKRYYAMFGKSLSRTQIQSQLVKKKQTNKFAWLNEVNSQSLLNALLNVHTAFTNFFKGRAKFPRFKSKKIPQRRYQCPQHCTVNFEQSIINLPKISSRTCYCVKSSPMLILFSDSGMAKGSNLSCYGSQRFPQHNR